LTEGADLTPDPSEQDLYPQLLGVLQFTTTLEADLGRALRHLWAGKGLTGRSLFIVALVRSGLDRPSMLVDYFDVLPSTMTFELNKLVAEKVLTRESVPGNGRSIRLQLTAEGEAMEAAMKAVINRFMLDRVSVLEPGELEHLLAIGRKIARLDDPQGSLSAQVRVGGKSR
jgi:DNA-binding MarR family transcriptional regulator